MPYFVEETDDGQKAYEVLKRSFALNPFNIWAFNMLQMLDRRFKPGEMRDIEDKKFVVRVPEAESKIYGDMIDALYKDMIPEYEAQYRTTVRGPDETGGRLLVEVLMDHNDFSVRSVGLPNLDALGVCFGRIVTMPSPRDLKARLGDVNWRIVLRHETSHAFTLQLSDFRIPRWLTEGIAMYDEGLPEYQWDTMLAYAHHNGEDVSLAGLNKYFGRPEGRRDVELAYSISYLAVGWISREWGANAPYKLALAYKKYGISAHLEAIHEALNMDLGNFDSRLRAELKRYVEEEVPLLPPVSEKALEEATKALQLHPTDQDALTTLIRGLMASGQVREGDELLKRALSLYSHDPILLAIKAQRLLDAGKNEEAWTTIEPTVKVVEKARFWNTFIAGIASAGMGEDKRAVELLTAAEKKCPHYIDANNPGKMPLRVLLAKSLSKLGRNKEAIVFLDKELALSTSNIAAAKMLDEVAKLEGDNEKRLTALNRMVDIDPFDAATRLTRFGVLMSLGKAEEAFIEARAASVLEEENNVALEDMVKAAVGMGGKIGRDAAKEALEASRKLAAADPKNAVLARYAKEIGTLKEKADGK